MATIVEHRRSTRHQGIYELVLLVVMLVVFGFIHQWFFAHWVWDRGFFLFIGVMALLGAVLGVHAVWEILQNGEFVCRLDSETFECSVPSRFSGETFRIRVGDIARIEKKTGGEMAAWYLWDKEGRRYWLTGNYGNPIAKFVAAIRKLNPGVNMVD
jgi:hypothetical protein